MRELYVFCEGQTEQGFCNQLLRPHFFPEGSGRVHTILIAHSRHHRRIQRGGIGTYITLRRDILNTMRQRSSSADVGFTTMIDVYKSPRDFPGKDAHQLDPTNPTPYVEALERAFAEDINDRRFVPYLQLFEFETLLFANPDAFKIAFEDCDPQITELKRIAASVPSIELIDDGEATAPSKRIIQLLPAYAGGKANHGPDIAEFIGLASLREACPHFHQWVAKLEARRNAGC